MQSLILGTPHHFVLDTKIPGVQWRDDVGSVEHEVTIVPLKLIEYGVCGVIIIHPKLGIASGLHAFCGFASFGFWGLASNVLFRT